MLLIMLACLTSTSGTSPNFQGNVDGGSLAGSQGQCYMYSKECIAQIDTYIMYVQWNLSIADTLGPEFCPLYRSVRYSGDTKVVCIFN